jgi:predicted dithiol-disulfide oxidoreductase (DUF899 family)
MDRHHVVSQEAWTQARKELLAKEKEFTRLRDELSRARRELPWVRVDKTYVFEGVNGKATLADLFEGRSQLIVYHFMFDPAWEAGCKSCSFWADNFNGIIVHLNHRDASMVAISRASYEKLASYRARMGWSFKWVSSLGNDFNRDYHVTHTPEELARRHLLQLHAPEAVCVGGAGHQRVLQGRRRRCVPHLFLLRARSRHAQWRLSLPRSAAQGA